MGEQMSNYSIKNIARVIDVRQAVSVDSFHASNELVTPLKLNRTETGPVHCIPSTHGSVDRLAVASQSKTDNTLLALLGSVLTQLQSLISRISNQPSAVKPVPAPPVSPTVALETTLFKPHPAADIPGLSSKRGGTKPDDIWNGFRQGPDGNCVTVSAIKAAMYRFGQSPTDIYQEVTKLDDGYRVVMRDGFQLTLTDRELAVGAAGAKFKGQDKETIKDAQFLFAVSAKRAQRENNDGTAGRSYQAAIRSLNDGEDERAPGEGFLRLGLRQHMRTVSPHELARGQVGMCNRAGHSVAVIHGREDKWGRPGSAPRYGDAIALV